MPMPLASTLHLPSQPIIPHQPVAIHHHPLLGQGGKSDSNNIKLAI